MLLWTFLFLCGYMSSFFLSVYLQERFLSHMATLCLTFWGTTRLFRKQWHHVTKFLMLSKILGKMRKTFIKMLTWEYYDSPSDKPDGCVNLPIKYIEIIERVSNSLCPLNLYFLIHLILLKVWNMLAINDVYFFHIRIDL